MSFASQNSDKAKLKQLCIQILEDETPIVLLNASKELYRLLSDTGGIDENNIYKNDLITPSGKAIASLWAAMCITDFLRTQRFFRGIHQALIDSKAKYPSEKINILYAGTGPFATLALPIMCLFSKDEVSFTMLEIQETSVNILHKILEYYDFQDYVCALIKTDATSYQLEKSKRVHIVISETMQHALEKEPQVEIAINLANQVDNETIWIPQDIKIEVGLMNMKKDNDRQLGLLSANDTSNIDIGTIFCLNKKSAKKLNKNLSLSDKVQYKLSGETILAYPWLVLMTTIHIYGDQYLKLWDSGLCAPRVLVDLAQNKSMPYQVVFWYKTGASPGFEYKLLYR